MSEEATALVRVEEAPRTSMEIRAQVNRIQEVMKEVMQENVHFGKVPGTPKPSLWKPGAEKLGMTFHIAVDAQIDADLSTSDVIRYRIRAVATTQSTGVFLGAALGECSSDEEKYRWRAAVCTEEFEETPIDRRRKKWKKAERPYAVNQVRTEPADIANTVLKMAVKRAEVAVMLKVCAASDIFTQDVEDMPEEIREQGAAEEKAANGNGGNGHTNGHTANGSATNGQAKPTGDAPLPANAISEAQAKRFFAIWKGRGDSGWNQKTIQQLLADHNIPHDRAITKNYYDSLCRLVEKQTYAEYMDLKAKPA